MFLILLPSSNFIDLIETLGEIFHSEELAVNLGKLYPNESGSLERFAFLRWYVDEEVSLDYADEEERLVGWGLNVSLMYFQWES